MQIQVQKHGVSDSSVLANESWQVEKIHPRKNSELVFLLNPYNGKEGL